jgi:hypothetical protein
MSTNVTDAVRRTAPDPTAGSKLAPAHADRYLARTNVNAQQTPDPIDPGRPDYLYEPLDDRGAHGPFDAEAKPRSLAFELRAALTRGGRRVRGG